MSRRGAIWQTLTEIISHGGRHGSRQIHLLFGTGNDVNTGRPAMPRFSHFIHDSRAVKSEIVTTGISL